MIEIVYLGGKNNGTSSKNGTTSEKSLDFIKINNGFDVEIKHSAFATVKTDIPYREEYFLKFIKRDNLIKIFYVFQELSVDEIKELSTQYWDKTYTIGYDFN